MKRAVMCIVQDRARAEAIVDELRSAGFTTDDISVLFPDQAGTKDFAHEHHTKAPEGAIAGVGAGGAIGGTIGLLAGIGAIAIPGVGPLIAAGPVLAALSGVAAGATVGGVAGALIGMGIPEIEARRYEGKLRGGNLLLSVHAESSALRRQAETIFRAARAEDVCSTGEASVPRGRESGSRA
jgi:hypothetical protein